MKIFEVAGVGKLHGLTVMSLDSFVNKDDKEVEESAVKTVHRIGLTVTDPNHPMVSKRGETYQKSVRVTGEDREKAINSAIAHYRRKGYQVHDHHYIGTVEDSLKEFAPGAGGDDNDGEDPYRYPKPEHFSRSVDFFGQFEAGHFDQEDMNDATGEFKGYWSKTQIAYFKFDNPANTGGDDPGMGWYYEPNTAGNNSNDNAAPAVDTSAQRKQQELGMIRAFLKSGQKAKPGSQIYSVLKRHGMVESGGEPDIQPGMKTRYGTVVSVKGNDVVIKASNGDETVVNIHNIDRAVAEGSYTETNYDGNLLVSLIQNYTPQSYAGDQIKQDLSDPASLPFHLADVVGLIDEIFYESLENGSEGVVLPDEKQDLRFFYQAAKKSQKQGMAEGGEKYKVKSIGHDAKGDYYISPSTGKKVYKSGVERGDHENPNTGEIKKNIAEAPGDFGLGANYRAVPDDEMQALMGRSKNKEKTKRDKYDYPYIHGSNIEVKDEAGKTFDSEALKKSIMVRPASILGQNAKMQHSETGEEAIFDIGLPALKGLAVNEKTGEFVVVDTCPGAGECKTFCYAMKGSYVMFKAVSLGLARMLNFLLNDPEGFANKLNAEITAAKAKMAKKNAKVVVRWHDAGDFFSPEYLDMAYGVANANPDVGFYAYTKMGDVATGARPKNFKMNFSGGALSSQEKKIDFKRVKHSKVVPKDMFFDLIARDGNNLKKDAKGRMQFASPANLEQFKSTMAQKYAIDRDSILTYDEMMKTPVGDTPKWNTIVMPGDGDNSANRNDVIGSYLLFH